MKCVLLTVPSAKEDWSDQVESFYLKKINHFIKFEIVKVKSKKNDRNSADLKIAADSNSILEQLSGDDYVILFDEKGEAIDSIKFSQRINQALCTSKKRLVFIIGGAFGVNEDVSKRVNLKISLSNMVFNHLVAETVALEQIYRGFTIIKNIPYHNI